MKIPSEKIKKCSSTLVTNTKYSEPLTEYQKSEHPEKDIIERIRYLAVDSSFTEENCIFLYKVINQDIYAIAKQYALGHMPKWFEIASHLTNYIDSPMYINCSIRENSNIFLNAAIELESKNIVINKRDYTIFYYVKDKDEYHYVRLEDEFLNIERAEAFTKDYKNNINITYSNSFMYFGEQIYMTEPMFVDTIPSYIENSFKLNLTLKDVLSTMKG